MHDDTALRQGRADVHFARSIDVLRREHATFLDRSVFLGAFVGEESNKTEGSPIDSKKHSGFGRIDVARYFVPLPALGMIGPRVILHKHLRDRVPDAALARSRSLRRWRYGRQLSGTRQRG